MESDESGDEGLYNFVTTNQSSLAVGGFGQQKGAKKKHPSLAQRGLQKFNSTAIAASKNLQIIKPKK